MVGLLVLISGAAVVNTGLALVLAQWLPWPWAVLCVSPFVFVGFVYLGASGED